MGKSGEVSLSINDSDTSGLQHFPKQQKQTGNVLKCKKKPTTLNEIKNIQWNREINRDLRASRDPVYDPLLNLTGHLTSLTMIQPFVNKLLFWKSNQT